MLAVSIRSDDSFFWIVENKVLIFIEPKVLFPLPPHGGKINLD